MWCFWARCMSESRAREESRGWGTPTFPSCCSPAPAQDPTGLLAFCSGASPALLPQRSLRERLCTKHRAKVVGNDAGPGSQLAENRRPLTAGLLTLVVNSGAVRRQRRARGQVTCCLYVPLGGPRWTTGLVGTFPPRPQRDTERVRVGPVPPVGHSGSADGCPCRVPGRWPEGSRADGALDQAGRAAGRWAGAQPADTRGPPRRRF